VCKGEWAWARQMHVQLIEAGHHNGKKAKRFMPLAHLVDLELMSNNLEAALSAVQELGGLHRRSDQYYELEYRTRAAMVALAAGRGGEAPQQNQPCRQIPPGGGDRRGGPRPAVPPPRGEGGARPSRVVRAVARA